MTTPKHVHDAVIRAWLDGKTVQYQFGDVWYDIKFCNELTYIPTFSITVEYRIKPDVLKYKRFLYACSPSGKLAIRCIYLDELVYDPTQRNDFVRWIDTEWQEVEL